MKTGIWRHLKHIKTPTFVEEVAISDTIEKIIVSILYKNSDYLNFIILENSSFLSVSGDVKNKQEFIEEIISSNYVRDLKYLSLRINIKNDNLADVYYVRYILYYNFKETFFNRKYELMKIDNQWKLKRSSPD